MSEIEGMGEAVLGGVLGHAVEPDTGAVRAEGHTQEATCLNCGTLLIGEHCHACGQRRRVHRTLRAFFHDLLHGLLHFEGKIWNTLPLLLWKPGELTRRYIDGERARFVSPIALFLFSVFLMFAVVNSATALGGDLGLRQSIEQGIAEERADLARLEAKRSKATGAEAARFDRRIATTRSDIAELEHLKERGITSATFQSDLNSVEGDALFKAAYSKARENPELLVYKLKNNAYKFSWALIPLSVPFLWLLFPFSRRFRLYDHIVFVTYSLSFMSLLLVAGLLLGAVGMAAIAGILSLIPPFHMYRQLRGTYGLGRTGALIRTSFLISFAVVALTLFTLLLLGVGLFD